MQGFLLGIDVPRRGKNEAPHADRLKSLGLDGFLGYSLPDDLVSGTGIRIAYSIMESIPVVGTYLAFFLFGGNYPGPTIIPRFFVLHVLIAPPDRRALAAHLSCWSPEHTQFPGKGAQRATWSGPRCSRSSWPRPPASCSSSTGVTALLGAFPQINPIWQFGQYDASQISYAVQPDWYMGWLDGALRIMPSWEFAGFGHTIPLEIFLPAVVFPGLIFRICLPGRSSNEYTKDNECTTCSTAPATGPSGPRPARRCCACWSALPRQSTDVVANFFQLPLNDVLWACGSS